MLPRFLQRPSVLSSVLLLCVAMHVRDDQADGFVLRSTASASSATPAPVTIIRAAGR
jgi:hypothetical protein